MELALAVRTGRDLLDQHHLKDWSIGLDRAKRRAGCCHFGDRLISLSIPLTRLHSEAEVRETLLHEIAHALAGPGHGHDRTWRRIAVEIGSTGERCVSPDAPSIPGRLTGVCPKGHEVTRHRRPSRVQSCSRCTSSFDPESLLAWTRDGVSIRMLPGYVAELVRIERTGSRAAADQLALDTLLGGGPATVPEQPRLAVHARAEPLAPGTAVTLLPEAGRFAGHRGVIVKFARTRYEVRTARGTLRVPPQLLAADVPDR